MIEPGRDEAADHGTQDEGAWTVRTVRLGELHFNVAEQGPAEGRPVLLLHGFPQTHRAFDALAAVLRARSVQEIGTLRLIAPDQRGYSPGARPQDAEAYGIKHVTQDAVDLLDGLGLDRVDVLGHDWGAVVAWNLAARHSARVTTLTAVSIPHPKAMAEALASDEDQQRRSEYIRLFRVPGHKAEDVLLEDGGRRLRAIYDPLPESAAAPHFDALNSRSALTPALSWYRAMHASDALSLPPTPAELPVTYIWSTADLALGRVAAERNGDYVNGPYRFIELDGISHWIPDQAPEALADALLDRISARS